MQEKIAFSACFAVNYRGSTPQVPPWAVAPPSSFPRTTFSISASSCYSFELCL